MSTTSARLLEAVWILPEPLLAVVLDFADFLRARQTIAASQPADIRLVSLCGALENSKTFSESPLAIPQKFRNEWH